MIDYTRKMAVILWYDWKSMFSGYMALTLLAPLMAILAVALSAPDDLLSGDNIDPVSVAIISGDDNLVNSMIHTSLEPIPLILPVTPGSLQEGLDMLDNNEVSAVVKIPDDFIDALIYNNPVSIEMWSGAASPAANAMLRGFADGIARAVSAAQSSIYTFYDVAEPYYNDWDAFYAEYSRLALNVMAEVLRRGMYVGAEQSLYDYGVQMLSLFVFMTGAIAAALVGIHTAGQLANGSYIRVRLNRLSYRSFILIKLCESIFTALCVSAPIIIGFFIITGDMSGEAAINLEIPFFTNGSSPFILLNIWKTLACVLIITVIFFGVSHTIAFFCEKPHWTALAAITVMLALMFAGGAFYPLYLFSGAVQTIGAHTPAGLNIKAVVWAAGGEVYPYGILLYALLAGALPFFLNAFTKPPEALA